MAISDHFVPLNIKRYASGLLVVLLLYTVGGFWLAPKLIQDKVVENITTILQRQATIAEVRLNPFTLQLDISDLRIMEPGGKELWLSFHHFSGKLAAFSSLAKQALVVKSFVLDTPHVQLIRLDEERFNISDILAKSKQKQASSGDELKRLFAFRLHNMEIINGDIRLMDRFMDTVHEAEEINLKLPFLSDDPAEIETTVTPHFSAIIDGSHFSMDAKSKPFMDSRETGISFNIKDLDLSRFQPYLGHLTDLTLSKGLLDLDLDLNFQLQKDSAPTLAVSGSTTLKDIVLLDPAQQELLSLALFSLEFKKISPLEGEFLLEKVVVQQPIIHLRREADGTVNLLNLLAGQQPSAEGRKVDEGGKAIVLEVDELELGQGKILFNDALLSQPKSQQLADINLTVDDFSNEVDSQFPFKFNAVINDIGHVNLDGLVKTKFPRHEFLCVS